jgi:hypothetical protein
MNSARAFTVQATLLPQGRGHRPIRVLLTPMYAYAYVYPPGRVRRRC